jgi:hypothetical protein
MTISDPREPLAKAHMGAFIDQPVAREAFSEVGVKSSFVSLCAATTKCNRMEDGRRVLCHERKSTASHVSVHGKKGRLIITRLQSNTSKTI